MSDFLTKEGYEKLQKELEFLKKEELPRASGDLREAISQGDLSENAAYDEARERKADVEKRIREIESKLAQAELVEERKGGGIGVGIKFKARNEESGEEKIFFIVGPQEAEPAQGKISFDSPLGQAFLDKDSGDGVVVITPTGEKRYTIVDIL